MPETKPKAGLGSLVVRPLLAGMVAAGAVAPVAAPAAEDLFLKIEGIVGESTDAKHAKEIVLLSYTQSFMNPVSTTSGGGGGTGKVNCGDVKVTKLVDRASPFLIAGVATGKAYPTALITFRKAGKTQIEYYKVTLSEVFLDAITQTDASPTDATTILEQLSMSAAKFQFEYRPQNADGSMGAAVKFSWDCRANKQG
ncbi:MAG TPA: type VI secretion system tube protein Hcp [Burkholderiales bacterium]|nr:type VI secretion system tube protein Hcp [Burkholderiales bacterium]